MECNTGGLRARLHPPVDHGRLLEGGEATWNEGFIRGLADGKLHTGIPTYKLARRMGAKRYRGKGKNVGRKVAAKMKQAAKMLSAMVLRWPAGGGFHYRSDGLGGNYRMRLQLETKEVLALVRAFVMMQKMGKRRGSGGPALKRAKPSSR